MTTRTLLNQVKKQQMTVDLLFMPLFLLVLRVLFRFVRLDISFDDTSIYTVTRRPAHCFSLYKYFSLFFPCLSAACNSDVASMSYPGDEPTLITWIRIDCSIKKPAIQPEREMAYYWAVQLFPAKNWNIIIRVYIGLKKKLKAKGQLWCWLVFIYRRVTHTHSHSLMPVTSSRYRCRRPPPGQKDE